MSRNSSFRFKNSQTDEKNIAAQLGVETLITGDIRQVGDNLVINVRLVDAGDGSQIWGNQYVRPLNDIITTQNEIAQAVAQNLRLKLSNTETELLRKSYTDNVEAYQHYIRGRFHIYKLTASEVQKGMSEFEQAIAIDPNYAPAHTGLAEGYRSLALGSDMSPGEFLPKSKAAAQRAIQIDDGYSQGHSALAMAIFWGEWDWAGAEKEFKRAMELDPDNSNAHMFYAHLLSNTGKHEEALAEARTASELEPLVPFVNALEGQFLIHAGRMDEGLVQLSETFDLDPNFWMPHLFAASAYIEKGMYAEAVAEARKARELSAAQTQSYSFESYALAKWGKTDEARAVRDELLKISKDRWVPPYSIAIAYNGLNDTDETFAWLERGFQQHDPKMAFLNVEPKWNNLRSDPRFAALIRKMNLQ
jgi:serine/threonine-protein kinase